MFSSEPLRSCYCRAFKLSCRRLLRTRATSISKVDKATSAALTRSATVTYIEPSKHIDNIVTSSHATNNETFIRPPKTATTSRVSPAKSRAATIEEATFGRRKVSPVDTKPSKTWINTPLKNDKLSYRWETLAPTDAQLDYADKLFTKRPPTFLWSAPKFHSMSFGDSPEVCVLGRSNIGKSSLLNALFGRDVAHSSSKPGRTRMMNAFAIGADEHNSKNRLVVLDMPGYGHGGQASWGTEILKYLSKRKQLTRAFVLIDTMHGMKKTDEQLLALFRQEDIPHQIILSKADRLLFPSAVRLPSESALDKRLEELKNKMEDIAKVVQPDTEDESGALGEVIACTSEMKIGGKKFGIDLVRHAMLQAAELEYQPPRKTVETPEIIPYDQIFPNSQTAG